jgi:hypothetical protein
MRTQTSKAKSQQLNTHQKNLETEPAEVEPIYRGGISSAERIYLQS